jgi:hypothetical protein
VLILSIQRIVKPFTFCFIAVAQSDKLKSTDRPSLHYTQGASLLVLLGIQHRVYDLFKAICLFRSVQGIIIGSGGDVCENKKLEKNLIF